MPEENKTSLTNPAVQGSAENDPSLQRRGQDGLKGSETDDKGVPWENRAKEYQKKFEAVTEKYDNVVSRLEQLENKTRLTEAERTEKRNLENRQDDLEDQLRILETHPDYKAFPEYVRRNSKKVKEEAVSEAYTKIIDAQVNQMLRRASKKFDLEPKELRSELLKIMKVSHQEMEPLERVDVLLDEYAVIHSQRKEDAEKKKAESKQVVSEGTGRANREKGLESSRNEGDITSRMKLLGI